MGTFTESRAGRRAQAQTSLAALELMRATDGWRVVAGGSAGGGDRCGLTAHRGVLHPDEYVDGTRLVPELERRLGFTVDELRAVYRQGRKSPAQRMLRERIDARLLRLRDAGGNIELLAGVVGIDRKVIGRAMARARAA